MAPKYPAAAAAATTAAAYQAAAGGGPSADHAMYGSTVWGGGADAAALGRGSWAAGAEEEGVVAERGGAIPGGGGAGREARRRTAGVPVGVTSLRPHQAHHHHGHHNSRGGDTAKPGSGGAGAVITASRASGRYGGGGGGGGGGSGSRTSWLQLYRNLPAAALAAAADAYLRALGGREASPPLPPPPPPLSLPVTNCTGTAAAASGSQSPDEGSPLQWPSTPTAASDLHGPASDGGDGGGAASADDDGADLAAVLCPGGKAPGKDSALAGRASPCFCPDGCEAGAGVTATAVGGAAGVAAPAGGGGVLLHALAVPPEPEGAALGYGGSLVTPHIALTSAPPAAAVAAAAATAVEACVTSSQPAGKSGPAAAAVGCRDTLTHRRTAAATAAAAAATTACSEHDPVAEGRTGGGGSDGGGGDAVSSPKLAAPPPLVTLRAKEPVVPRPPPGVRHYPDGRGPSYRMSLPYRLLAAVTLGVYVGWPYALLGLLVGVALGSVRALAALAALAATLLLPAPPRPWEALLSSRLFRLWRAYFNFSFAYDEMLDLTRPYLFVTSPHGAFPLSQVLGNSLGSQLWPGHPVHCLAASVLFYVPLWRHIKAWMGAAPADRRTARLLLATRGSVAVLAGGIAEMYEQELGRRGERERVKLVGRRGFVRVAVETGVPIVPVYHFGNSQVLSFGPVALQPLSRRLRVALGTVVGVCGLPVPRPQPLFMAVGRPIHVPYTDPRDPRYERLVDETLDRVIASYKELYDRYSKVYGWEHRPLEVC
ncbi:hypothetical protein GPECTOR_60g776 [Gonium pectorale]|uniref:Acyltransferase n=1 Tax=Gonium pectorale TaxID=33097 RepID=A0A150G573_GONPE|nr:hypothetical protein GPECTOR_60g776 [Gonium pectorale]|eukprot:KXZ44997.1 hypothetical protein GPECTOR_60g776 [Gonium pectorale]